MVEVVPRSKSLTKEEMNVFGFAYLGAVFSKEEVAFFRADVLQKKAEDIEQFGRDVLVKNGDLEVVRDLARFGGPYLTLLENVHINTFVNDVLNEKAVVHSYNAIITRPDLKTDMLGYRFHRDQPLFKDTRTSINIMIPLVDYSAGNGSTEFVPTTHLFKEMPSDDFMEKHTISARGTAGEAFAVDAALWHRAGKNASSDVRPMLAIKYTLAPFKQQVDFCESAKAHLPNASDLIRQRLGWDVRVCQTYEEFREPGNVRKFKSGQYDMSNTDIHG
jgi:ectoine hydroxylase-related dioxygenase (phytanoyl-CoA dioxygenase family)